MRKNKVSHVMWMALAPVGASLMATSAAHAQFTTYTNTFDTAGSFQTTANYNPPPIAVRYDYGGIAPTATHSVAWTGIRMTQAPAAAQSSFHGSSHRRRLTPKTCQPLPSPNSATSVAYPDGSESAAFTFDLFPSPGFEVTNISFNLMVDPSSTPDAYGGYGYFQVFTRDANYNDNATPFAEELGNPTYGGIQMTEPGNPLIFHFRRPRILAHSRFRISTTLVAPSTVPTPSTSTIFPLRTNPCQNRHRLGCLAFAFQPC